MPRNFAYLEPSGLQLPFTGNYKKGTETQFFVTLAALGRRQSQYIFLQIS